MNKLFLVPAYGRIYNTKHEALKAWSDGKDFRISDGPYTSIRDFMLFFEEYDEIYLVYGKDNSRVERL